MNTFGDETFTGKLDEILHLTQENNRMLRGMRRDRWFGVFAKIAVWGAILAVSYYFTMQYLTPILSQVQQLQSMTQGFSGTPATTGTGTATSTGDVQKILDLYNQYKGTVGQ